MDSDRAARGGADGSTDGGSRWSVLRWRSRPLLLGAAAVVVLLAAVTALAAGLLGPSPATADATVSAVVAAEVPGSDGDLRALAAATGGAALPLTGGTFIFSDFLPDGANFIGAQLPAGGVTGAGQSVTVLKMDDATSTQAAAVPTTSGSTIQLSLLKVAGAPVLSGFTVSGSNQGHLYNRLRLQSTTGASISNVKVLGIPGDDHSPPGETFGINDFHGAGDVFDGVEVDGAGVGAAGLGTNGAQDVTVRNGNFHGSAFSHGATFWQTKNILIQHSTATDNKDVGFNFERVTGDVRLENITVGNNAMSDLRMVSDQGSTVFTIVDPVFTGPRLSIMWDTNYLGVPNAQRQSDIHVVMGGADVTASVVEWRTR